jgi:hypothetical protein
LIYTIVAFIVIGGFCCLSVLAFMLPIDEDIRLFVWVGLIITFIITASLIILIGAMLVIRRRASELDKVFLPLGLEGRRYLTNGRQYHGTFRNYPFYVYFFRGPTLQIYLEVPLRTRLGIGRQGAISGLAANITNKQVLSLDDPDFEDFVIYPEDRQWAAKLFADPQARQIILRLIAEDAAVELRTLSITPNALLWQSRYNPQRNIKADSARAWFNDLCELARIAQGLRAPSIIAEESDLERNTRTDRGKYIWPIISITCGIFAALAACIIAISLAFILLAESGY